MFDLTKIRTVSVGVLGDLALDIYWYADMKKSELSRETPHYPLPVVREVMSPGAGGNVVANIAALRPGSLSVCGIGGNDWRGDLLKKKLSELGADLSGWISEEGRFTQAYCKPMRMGISDVIYEDPRLDFAATAPISAASEAKVLRWLDEMDGKLDVLCVCDQFKNGIVTDAVLDRLTKMHTPVLVDSRNRIGQYHVRGVLKPNELECRAALAQRGLIIPENEEEMARALSRETGAAVFLTLGEYGSIFVSSPEEEAIRTPVVPTEGPIDICGAGDTSLSAFACCMAAGANPAEAAQMAALASAVTIRKIATTGTASPEEINALAQTVQ